jgi:hypothetical protein
MSLGSGVGVVATQILTHAFDKISKKSKIAKKQRKPPKLHF